jgi:Tat protein translocase TatB subunit
MFDIGFPELVLCTIIGLLVLGPQRLPKVAAEIGKWVGRARRTATQLRRQLEREIELDELQSRQPPPRPAPPPDATPPPPAATPPQTTETATPPPTTPSSSASPATEAPRIDTPPQS